MSTKSEKWRVCCRYSAITRVKQLLAQALAAPVGMDCHPRQVLAGAAVADLGKANQSVALVYHGVTGDPWPADVFPQLLGGQGIAQALAAPGGSLSAIGEPAAQLPEIVATRGAQRQGGADVW